ncbi:hypothetical protein [uncultured Metabacillus sp.]|uniref:hypothetical protein n=1 Tax=uncultured Metabacillus sp. TaxID=2860135 RepID=UPI00262E5B62|nr:hypothetical protein [uncultured Metabacillus sp.]
MYCYYSSYLKVLKQNFLLAIIALMLLIPTFFIWAGIPFFVVGSVVGSLTTSPILIYLCISLSGGVLFSLYFLPINLKVARSIAVAKKRSSLNSFMRLEAVWIVVVAMIFGIVLTIIVQ